MTSIPTVKQELERKTLDTCEWLLLKLEAGEITVEQFSLAVDAMFMTVSGLVGKEFLDFVHQADAIAKSQLGGEGTW